MAMKYKTHDAMHGPGCREAALPLGTSTAEGREGRSGTGSAPRWAHGDSGAVVLRKGHGPGDLGWTPAPARHVPAPGWHGGAGSTYLPWACWGRACWRTPRPHSPAAAAPGTPSDLAAQHRGRQGRWPHAGLSAASRWHRVLPAALPSMMCFRDSPLSVSALKEEEAEVRARRAPAALLQGRVGALPTFLPRRFWW